MKAINQYDLQGNFIKTWESSLEIERRLGFNSANVRMCCKGKRFKAGEFQWKYVKVDKVQKYKGFNVAKRIKVLQVDNAGNIIKKFNSIKHAALELGLSSTNVCQVCKGHQKQTKGFYFKYSLTTN